jgi:hypothetical protein
MDLLLMPLVLGVLAIALTVDAELRGRGLSPSIIARDPILLGTQHDVSSR